MITDRETTRISDQPRAANAAKVVAELFTSQGCSSCPPADVLAAEIAQDDHVLLISRPVTYWDRLGWEDSLALEENNVLQRLYAQSGQSDGVYTPQLMVAGEHAVIGSRRKQVYQTLRDQLNKMIAEELEINHQKTENGGIEVIIRGNLAGMVQLVALSSSETVEIGNGENGGRTVHYTNVLIDEQPVGFWHGGDEKFHIAPDQLNIDGADSYALLIRSREDKHGKLLGGIYLSENPANGL